MLVAVHIRGFTGLGHYHQHYQQHSVYPNLTRPLAASERARVRQVSREMKARI